MSRWPPVKFWWECCQPGTIMSCARPSGTPGWATFEITRSSSTGVCVCAQAPTSSHLHRHQSSSLTSGAKLVSIRKKKNKACSGPSRHFYLYLTSGQHRPRLLPPSLVLSLSLLPLFIFFSSPPHSVISALIMCDGLQATPGNHSNQGWIDGHALENLTT